MSVNATKVSSALPGEGTDDNTATTGSPGAEETKDTGTTEDQENENPEAIISEALEKYLKDGKLEFPDDVPKELRLAVIAEKRRRDTQAAYTKTSQELARERKLRAELERRVSQRVELELTPEQKQELEELKQSDPDAYITRRLELEDAARAKLRKELEELEQEAEKSKEAAARKAALVEFNQTAKIALTDEVLELDIPPRIHKKLEKGEISYRQFLEEAEEWLLKQKGVHTKEAPTKPRLNSVGGGDANSGKSDSDDYASMVL